jgi:hypothetical protein
VKKALPISKNINLPPSFPKEEREFANLPKEKTELLDLIAQMFVDSVLKKKKTV